MGASIGWILSHASDYYIQTLVERPHHDRHHVLKPSGVIGHGLGIVGSLMLILLLSYSVRKRFKRLRNAGKLSTWLNYHIFLGISGPILITFHTAFKFGGLVSIAYWSMVAVAVSGFIGRYIYVKIPRRMSGSELSREEIESKKTSITTRLKEDYSLSTDQIRALEKISAEKKITNRGLLGIFTFLYYDSIGRINTRRLLKRMTKSLDIDQREFHSLHSLIKQQIQLTRQIAFLSAAHRLFHYWHVIHRPFAYTMLVIMVIHTALAILFGYTWIWS